MGQIEVQESLQARLLRVYGHTGDGPECDAQKEEVITIESKGARPKTLENLPKARFIDYAPEDAAGQQRREEDEPLGC
jgi:hypothetical protein